MPVSSEAPAAAGEPSWRNELLERHRWLGYVLPLAVFMLSGYLDLVLSYPATYLIRIVLTIVAIVLVMPTFRRFPVQVRPTSLLVGAVGAVMWIGLCELHWETRWLAAAGWDSMAGYGARTGFNPGEELAGSPLLCYGFLAVRLVGLALVIPVIEEFFLRGFVTRFAMRANWWEVPVGRIDVRGWVVVTVTPLLMHPVTEALAVLVWFFMVTLWMVRTRSLWDCVVVHAVTNLLLGGYVIASGAWYLM